MEVSAPLICSRMTFGPAASLVGHLTSLSGHGSSERCDERDARYCVTGDSLCSSWWTSQSAIRVSNLTTFQAASGSVARPSMPGKFELTILWQKLVVVGLLSVAARGGP